MRQAERERQAAAAADAVRQVLPCEDCGRDRSAGLCEACDHRRQTEALIGEAGLLAATWSADLTDPVAVAAVATEVRTAIEDATAASWAEFQKITDPAALEAAGPDAVEDAAAHNAMVTAESAAAEYQHEALVMLGRSKDAQAEAHKAHATELAKPWHQALPDSDDAQRAATEAAAQAQTRTAEHLLAVRLEQLHAQARPEPARPALWSRRLPERRPPAGRRGSGGDRVSAVPELSGVDLARQALLAAREAAKNNGVSCATKPKRRTGTTLRRDGREPLGLGAAITTMTTERGLVAPAAGGSALAQFDDILAAAAPELAGHVKAVKFDADTGRLDVAPDAPAYGTKVRWIGPKLIAAANEKAPGANVRALHVLPPGAIDTTPPPAADRPAPSATAVPARPVKTRETASTGYRLALDAHRAAVDPAHQRPAVPDAVGPSRVPADSREAFADYRTQARETASAVQDVAIRRARAERAAA